MMPSSKLMATLLLVGGLACAGPAWAAVKKAMCVVCQVKHGEVEEEPVKAVRTHQGTEYGFCSEDCAKAFDADPAAYVPQGFPRPAPIFAVKDLTGGSISNESLHGKVVLLDFWATWCAPCRKSMPELQALHHKYAARGFTVVGVSIDEGGPGKVKKYVASKRITYPIAMDSDKDPAWDAFRVKAVPAAYLLDRQGRIVAQWTGSPADTRALESKLEELLAVD
jgi:peroxiredoxin/YHS domain-containing protein